MKAMQRTRGDVSSMTEDSDYNHNHNHSVSSYDMAMDSDVEDAIEENNILLAHHRHRKPITDLERNIVQ